MVSPGRPFGLGREFRLRNGERLFENVIAWARHGAFLVAALGEHGLQVLQQRRPPHSIKRSTFGSSAARRAPRQRARGDQVGDPARIPERLARHRGIVAQLGRRRRADARIGVQAAVQQLAVAEVADLAHGVGDDHSSKRA